MMVLCNANAIIEYDRRRSGLPSAPLDMDYDNIYRDKAKALNINININVTQTVFNLRSLTGSFSRPDIEAILIDSFKRGLLL